MRERDLYQRIDEALAESGGLEPRDSGRPIPRPRQAFSVVISAYTDLAGQSIEQAVKKAIAEHGPQGMTVDAFFVASSEES